jgi:hypothetical protein
MLNIMENYLLKTIVIKSGEEYRKTSIVLPFSFGSKFNWVATASILSGFTIMFIVGEWLFILLEKRRVHNLLRYHY